jgi:hypothetical protein
MDNKICEKGMEIVAKLLAGEEISESGSNISFYQEYNTNADLYDFVHMAFKKMNINLYEYNNGLYISAGENNTAFGFSNEELKRILGIRLNRELYLVYFVIYNIIIEFYNDSATTTYVDCVQVEDIIENVDNSINGIIDRKNGIVLDEVEENSFRQIALSWEELPAVSGVEQTGIRAAKNSKVGFVKMVFNFCVMQDLMIENEGRYYATDRFRALIENYFDDYHGRLSELLNESQMS